MVWSNLWRSVNRRKTLLQDYVHHSEYSKSLNGLDLFAIAGVVSLPLGIFAVLPDTIRTTSGPSTVLAIMLAYMLTLVAGWHQAELTVAFPKTCLLYHYTYVMIGEIWAFLVGWMTLLDYLISASYVSRVWSAHMNLLFNESLYVNLLFGFSNIKSYVWATSFDCLALIGLFAASLLQCLGLKVLCTVGLVLLTVCALISSSAILVAFFYANPSNWIHSGFFSHGYIGVFAGASRLMYSFIGIESLSYVLEESHQPTSRIPSLSPICSTILSIFFLLFSLAISLAMDYTKFPAVATLPMIYGSISVRASRYIVSVASVCGLSGALLVILLPSSRTIQVLSSHRLLLPSFARLSGKNNTPIVAIIITLLMSVVLLLFKVEFLTDILSVTLPLRLLMTVLYVILQRFSAFPIGNSSEVSRYKSLKKRRCHSHSESFLTLNGSTISCPYSEEHHCHQCDDQSINSSVICRNIGIAQMGAYNWEIDKECRAKSPATISDDVTLKDQITEKSSLLASSACNGESVITRSTRLSSSPSKDLVASPPIESSLVKSASNYHAVPQSDTKTSLHTVSLCGKEHSHDCLRSTCLPNATDGSRVFHLYEADLSELPYQDTAAGMGRSCSATLVTQQVTHSRAVLATVIFIIISVAINLIITKARSAISGGEIWAMVTISVLSFLLFINMVYIVHLSTNKLVSPRRYQVSLFPFLSLVALHCLSLLLCATSQYAWIKLFFWNILGILVYLSYGHVHSSEQVGMLLEKGNDATDEEHRQAIIDDTSALCEERL